MSYPKIELADAVVLITGGGRGIGAATAELFAAKGATVWIGDRDLGAAKETAARLNVQAVEVDVTDRASFAAFVRTVLDAHGRIDVVVNNAGVMPLGGFLEESDATSRTTMDVNVWGPMNGMREALPHMIERGRGHVVNVVSMAGKIPIPGMAVYNASKFGALGLSLAVREEYEPSGVSVSTVLPGAVRTRLSSGVPLGRGLPTVDPEDVAKSIVDSVGNRRAEIPVPSYLAGWGLLDATVPAPLMKLGRRLVGDRRGLDSVDHKVRDLYENTITDQAKSRQERA